MATVTDLIPHHILLTGLVPSLLYCYFIGSQEKMIINLEEQGEKERKNGSAQVLKQSAEMCDSTTEMSNITHVTDYQKPPQLYFAIVKIC